MRYSSALVLATLAIGQATAGRHASFHQRRRAESKRDLSDVDWSKVAYDLKDVDWNAVFDKPAASSAAAAAPAPAPTSSTPAPAPAAAAPTSSAAAPPTSSAAAAAPSVQAESADVSIPTVSNFMTGVASMASKLGIKVGTNSQAANGGAWIGTSSPWQAQVVNAAKEDAVFYCWRSAGYTGMFVASYVPDISVGVPAGSSVNLSFAPGVGMACSPVYPDTVLAPGIGYIFNTWWEVTFEVGTGAFDVSREPNMNGRTISAKGSKCTSDMNTCVFKCVDPTVQSCTTGYDLFGCGAGTGGGSGYDPVMKGTGGGCSMGANSETVVITIS